MVYAVDRLCRDNAWPGQRVSASAVQPGSNVLQVGRDVADRPFEAEIHEYKLAGADTSVWVRFVEIRSTMPGRPRSRVLPCLPIWLRLRLAGWHLGEYACGSTWVVEAFLGENQIRATADSQREAWQRAFEQAESIGLAGRAFY